MPDPRYASLYDYLQVVRRNKLLLLVSVVLFGVGAWLLTAGDKSVYQATTTLSFQDADQQTADLLNSSVTLSDDSGERVAINAATITRPSIVKLVAQRLPGVPGRLLTDGVTAAAENSTGFLVIQVDSTDPALAQALANAYGDAVKTEERATARAQFGIAAQTLKSQVTESPVKSNPVLYDEDETKISALEFAAETANPVSVATNAAVPDTPISPHPVRDALLGILLGLTLAIVIAFARDALDRRLRGSQEIVDELQWPILGHIKESALGRAGFVAANGNGRVGDADLEGFRILRQNIQFLNFDEPPRSIVVTSAKPEEGKSTVAASLACASALTGKRTLLVDCDLRRPTLAKRLGVESAPGLTDYLLGEAEPAEILRTIALGMPETNGHKPKGAEPAIAPSHVAGAQLVFIPAGKLTAYPSELLSSQRLRNFLAEVTKAYDLVVIDTPPVLPVADALEILAETDSALFCVRASKTTTNELRAVKQALERLPDRPAGVVITGVRSGSEADFGYYTQTYQYR